MRVAGLAAVAVGLCGLLAASAGSGSGATLGWSRTEPSAPGSALAERAKRVQEAAERCGRIVRSFLAMARQRKAKARPVTVQALVDTALQLLAYSMRTSGVTVEQDIAADLPVVLCDPDQIHQVLSNLLVNARQVLEEQPQPRLVRLTARADGEWVRL